MRAGFQPRLRPTSGAAAAEGESRANAVACWLGEAHGPYCRVALIAFGLLTDRCYEPRLSLGLATCAPAAARSARIREAQELASRIHEDLAGHSYLASGICSLRRAPVISVHRYRTPDHYPPYLSHDGQPQSDISVVTCTLVLLAFCSRHIPRCVTSVAWPQHGFDDNPFL
jgi:hypothetical protein